MITVPFPAYCLGVTFASFVLYWSVLSLVGVVYRFFKTAINMDND